MGKNNKYYINILKWQLFWEKEKNVRLRVCLVHMIGRHDMIKLSYPNSICCLVHQ